MPAPVNQDAAVPVDGWLSRLAGMACRARCLVCGETAGRAHALCAACADALPWNGPACTTCAWPLPVPRPEQPPPLRCGPCLRQAPPLQAAHAAFVYAFPIDRLLPRFKFHHDLAVGRLLAGAMVAVFAPLPRPDAIVPVPLHLSRLRSRGYDQALELARPVARCLGVPVHDRLLRRARQTAPQSRLDAASRVGNLRGAFAVRTPAGTAVPTHVALVDDVMTTGATLHAAARALRAAGVARVDAWVCARAP